MMTKLLLFEDCHNWRNGIFKISIFKYFMLCNYFSISQNERAACYKYVVENITYVSLKFTFGFVSLLWQSLLKFPYST